MSTVVVEVSTNTIEIQQTGAQGATGEGVPTGGTTGQVLAKASNTNYDTEWVTGGGGGASAFTDLTDVPNSYTGESLKYVRVNVGETALEFDALTKSDVGLSNVVNADTTTTANITDSLNKRFITDAQQTVLENTSGTNTGDQDLSGYQPLDAQLTSVAGLSYAGNALKVIQVNAGENAFELGTVSAADEKVKVSSNDTTAKYLEDAIVVSHGSNGSTVLEKTTLNDGGDEDVQIQFDVSKVDLSNANNTTSAFVNAAGAKSAAVADAINNGTTDVAPSQNAVFDALALKYDASNPSNYIDAAGAVTAVVTQVITNGVTDKSPSEDAVFDALALKADLASPALTGNPTAPTQSPGDNSTKIATTAYADALVSDTAYDATSWNGVTGIGPSKNAVRDQIETMLTSIAAKQVLSTQTLTDGANIAWNLANGIFATVTLGAAGRTIDNPTNMVAGQIYYLKVIQDATGGRTITSEGSAYKWTDNISGFSFISSGANAVDIFKFVSDGTNMYGTVVGFNFG